VLRSLDRLLQSCGFSVQTFSSPLGFLAQDDRTQPGCVIVDLSMPSLNGLELQQALARSGDLRPVLFISGHGDIAASVAAMKAGAVDFVTKPLDADRLLEAVRAAVEKDRARRAAQAVRDCIEDRLRTLTPREHEVMDAVIAGKRNKQIAAELGMAEKTVKVHRARVMGKMGIRSVAELVRAWTSTRAPRPSASA
jgi:FixJ family two-component response regulator